MRRLLSLLGFILAAVLFYYVNRSFVEAESDSAANRTGQAEEVEPAEATRTD